ncbi:phosphate acyltransferase [Enterococcus sp. LJL90]
MTTIAIPGGGNSEILQVVKAAKDLYGETVQFVIFDEGENLDPSAPWDYHQTSKANRIPEAVKFVAAGHGDILMKGIVSTHDILKEVLQKEYNLRDQKLLSHVAIMHLEQLDRPILMTDSGMNIEPDAEQLKMIVKNAVKVAHQIGISHPKVALLSSAETYNPKMPSSVLATEVTQSLVLEDATIYGPLSLDLALSQEAVAHKRFSGPIAGDADILVVPNIDAGNVFYKSLLLFTNATMGGTIVGTKVPIVVTSRSDSTTSKLAALDLALKQLGG